MATNPTNVRWVVFGLASTTSWLLYLHRYVFALLKPKLEQEWGLDNVQLGLLDSAFSLTATLFQFPLGVAADAVGVRIVLTGLILLWCGGLALHAAAPSAGYLWHARAILGAGQSAVYATLSRIAQSWFPPPVRTTMQGFAGITCGRLGGMCANLLFATVLLGWLEMTWRAAIYLLAGSGAVFAIAFYLLFRNVPREHPWVNEAEAELIAGPLGPAPPAPRMSVIQMLRSIRPRAQANVLALNIQTILSTFADNIYSNWIPLFLFQVHALKFAEMGIYSALPLAGGAIAGLVGGALNDWSIRASGSRRWARTGVAAAGKGLAAVILLAALAAYDSPYWFCGLLFFVKFFGDWSLTTSWGVVTDIGGPATASVFAFNNAVAGVGLLAAPPIFGYVSLHYGWPVVFVAVAAAYVLCALSWLFIDCTIPVVAEEQQ
jgi:sugar phosphate permease